jgi:drug/metabolite transporter (DMT)-like permease
MFLLGARFISFAGATSLVSAGAVGALCYGVSIVLVVKVLRVLDAARESEYFATAPFVGALLSIVVFRELPKLSELGGAALIVVGVLSYFVNGTAICIRMTSCFMITFTTSIICMSMSVQLPSRIPLSQAFITEPQAPAFF